MELNLLNLLLLLLAAWLAGNAATRFGYPAVLGELLAGILLGPPLLGLLHGSEAIAVLAEVGVLLMMLYIGMEVDPTDLKKVSWAGALAAIGGFITPFVLAFLVVRWFGGSTMAALFVGIAAGITSLLTKSRILSDLKLLDTRVAHVMMAGALISDTLSLIIFTVILGVAESGVIDPVELALVTLRIVVFFAATTVIGLKVFPWVGHRLTEAGFTGRTFNFTLVLLIAVLFGEMAELAGLHAILGAFLAGLFLRENVLGRTLSQSLMNAVQDASIGFLAPIFFVTAGFEVSFSVFNTDLALFLSIMVVATVGKIAGTALFYVPTGNGWREGLVIGAGMNGRGAVEIIVAGIALEMGLISQDIFSILVFMAIFTTATVPLFLKWGNEWLRSRGELVRRDSERRGVLIVGADALARSLALKLRETEPVWMIDTNERRCSRARSEGLEVTCGNALQDNILAEGHAPEAARLIAMTSNAEVNMLVAQLAKDVFLVPEIHILQTGGDGVGRTTSFNRLGATSLFARPIPMGMWSQWIRSGAVREKSLTIRRQEVQTPSDLVNRLEQEGSCLALTIRSEGRVQPVHDAVSFREGDEVSILCHEPVEPVRVLGYDRFDRLVEEATILDFDDELSLEGFFEIVARNMSSRVGVAADDLKGLMLAREAEFNSLIAPGLAVPHVAVTKPGVFHLLIARTREGILFPTLNETATAIFVIVRSQNERSLHLRVLAAIAQIIQDSTFERRWEAADDTEALRRLLRESDRRRFD